ncbi:hypothetical protein B0T14DRAFT_424224 [Immersiella caudata]|uniref:VOC domain-containing protein n=1 Tax=Immersiella caudata TaxID=314043 RepID=A0AA39X3Z6_9PEZI|nr:hypothetical protein B0T14DRAFT_424224 [Immersiella caudata]
MALAAAHLRIARPTNNIEALLPFYRDGLGFDIVGQFADHEGFDGIMLSLKSAGYHLEFTRAAGHDAGRAPTRDNLLIFYLPDSSAFNKAVEQMGRSGFPPVPSFNPYWDRCGKTFEDPDGYRIVLANMPSPHWATMKGLRFWLAAALLRAVAVIGQEQTGNHVDWPRWCGKVYEAGYPNFDPGGQIVVPTPIPGDPLVHVQFAPRYSLYLDSEEKGEFIVNAAFSQYHGKAWPKTNTSRADKLVFSINLVGNGDPLVQNLVTINTTNNIFSFDLSLLKTSLEPIQLVLYGAPEGGDPAWTATSSVFYLPEKRNGSVTRIDNLNGGLWFRNAASKHRFEPLFAYGFYSSYDGFLRNKNNSEIQQYADLGLNAITPLTIYNDSAAEFAYMDKINLKFMYNLRERYKNLTEVHDNVLAARDAESIFAYWSADEPDGWQDPFSAPMLAYDLIRSLDPYATVVLNCQNYYFAEYSAAADILMADVYPIGINSTFSKWGTECNITHGDCGCDNCEGTVQDVPNRLDTLSLYESYLARFPPKPKVFSPQSFHGQDYWIRDPSPPESHVMVALSLNHGAASIISWLYPTSSLLARAHGALSRVITNSPVVDFLFGARPVPLGVKAPGTELVDAAGWIVGGKMLVCVVNGGYANVERAVEVDVGNGTVVSAVHWGSVPWKLEEGKLKVSGLGGMEVSMVVVELRGSG